MAQVDVLSSEGGDQSSTCEDIRDMRSSLLVPLLCDDKHNMDDYPAYVVAMSG